MKWTAIIPLFLLVAFGALSAAETPSNTIWLVNGDVLQGSLKGWVSTNAVLWKHPDLPDPVQIPLERIATIRLSDSDANRELTPDKWQVRLYNGDCFPGAIISMDAERLVLKTSYAGNLNLARPFIRSISLATTNVLMTDSPTNQTLIVMGNDDQVSGKLLGIQDGVIDFAASFSTVKIPLEKVRRIAMPVALEALPAPGPGLLIANLENNGVISLAIEKWDENGVTAGSPNFGHARFTPNAFRSLQITPSQNLRVRVYEDGTDRLHIQGNRVWFSHESWKFPGESDDGSVQTTRLNNEPWSPEWNDNRSTDFQLSTTPVPEGSFLRAKLEIIKVRGHVTVTQQPTSANAYETVVLIDDADIPAQDWYEFIIHWSTGD